MIKIEITGESGLQAAQQLQQLFVGLAMGAKLATAQQLELPLTAPKPAANTAAPEPVAETPAASESTPVAVVAEKPAAKPRPSRAKPKPAEPVVMAPATDDPRMHDVIVPQESSPEVIEEKAAVEQHAAAHIAANPIPEKPMNRERLTDTIKGLHSTHGDTIFVKVKAVLARYGAAKQSEVKEADIAKVVAELESLAK